MKGYPEHFNERMETLSEREYADTQEEALWKQLRYVSEKSAFYREKYAIRGIDLARVNTISEFQRLPFTEKTELRESQISHPPLGLHQAVAIEEVARIYSTSGTTGRPTYIGLSRSDVQVWTEAASRAIWTGGYRPGTIVPLITSPFFVAASYADAIENIGATIVPIGVLQTDRLIAAFQNVGANAILSTSSFPMHFAASLRKRGMEPKELGVRLILAGGEPGASIPEYREQVETTFECTFLEMMGNGDMCGQIFSECRYKEGMHFIAQGIVYPEIIDPDSLEILPIEVGCKGELVYTSLNRKCIPLVRFRTRDHVLVAQTECQCGRTGFGIRCIGRTDDMINVQGVNVYPSAVKDVILSFKPKTNGFMEIQIYKEPPEGWKPPLHIKVEVTDKAYSWEELKIEIEATIREKLIFRADIEFVPESSLPRFEYKAKLVNRLYEVAT